MAQAACMLLMMPGANQRLARAAMVAMAIAVKAPAAMVAAAAAAVIAAEASYSTNKIRSHQIEPRHADRMRTWTFCMSYFNAGV